MAATTIDEIQVLIRAQAEGFQRQINAVNKQLDSLNKTGGKVSGGIGKSFSAMKLAATAAVAAIGVAIAKNLGPATSRLDTLNNFPRVMVNLGVGADEAQKSIDYLSEKLTGLPTTLDQAALSVQQFTSVNNNIKASTAMFLAMNNAILAGGASAEVQSTALEQLSQAYAKGKADAQEWRAMLTAMPAQMKQIANAMGYESAAIGGDLQTALQNGEVSMNDFMSTAIQLNQQGYGGFASFEEQARTATGGVQTSIANLKTAIVRGLTTIMDQIGQSNIASFFNAIGKAIGTAANYVAAFVRIIKEAIAWVSALFGKSSGSTAGIVKETSKASDNIGGVASGANDAAGGLDKAAGAAKKLNKQLAGFDEMNVLADKDAGSSGGGSGGSGGSSGGGSIDTGNFDWNLDLGGTEDKIKELAEKMKAWIQEIFGEIDFVPLITSLKNFGKEGERVFKALKKIANSFLKNALTPIAKWTVEKGLPQFFNDTAKAFRKLDLNKIVKSFDSLFRGLSKFTTGIGEGLLTFYRGALLPISTFAMNNIIPPFLDAIGAALHIIGDVGENVSAVLSPILGILGQIALTPVVIVFEGISAALTAISQNEFAVTLISGFAAAILSVVAAYEAYQFIMGVVNGLELIRQGAILASTTGTAAYTAGVRLAATAQQLWTAAVAAFHALLSPVGLAIGALTMVFATLMGSQKDTTLSTEELRAKMSEHEQQIDENKNGILEYNEILKANQDVMAETVNADLALFNAQERQRQKTEELTRAAQGLKVDLQAAKDAVDDKALTDEQAASVLGININQYRDLKGKILEVKKADLDIQTAETRVAEAAKNTANQIETLKKQYNLTIDEMEATSKAGIGTEEIFNSNKDKAKSLQGQIEALGGTVEGMRSWSSISWQAGADIGQGAINGLNSKKYPWQQANTQFGQAGINSFKTATNTHSPSRVYTQLGEFLGIGAENGILHQLKPFANANKKLAEAGMSAFSNFSIDIPEIDTPNKLMSSALRNMKAELNSLIDGGDIISTIKSSSQTAVTVKIGDDTLVDKIINGINGRSFLDNRAVINV